jgi:hypothetical protein
MMAIQSTSHAQVVANAGPDTTICLGMAVQIGGSPTAWGGSPPYTYSWLPATGLSAVSDPNPFASPATTTTYTVTVHDNGGQTNTDMMIVTVNPNPVITIVPQNAVICAGSCITLSGSGGITYTWSGGLMGPNPTVCPATTTTYTVTGTNMNGCFGTATTTVVVDSALIVNLTTTNASCSTCTDGTATVSVLSGTPPYTYFWSNGSTVANQTALGVGTYWMTVTDANGCMSTDTCYIGIGNCAANFNLVPDSIVQHLYYAINNSSGVPPLHYLWSWGDGGSDTITYPSHTYAVAGLYNICVTINDSIGCSSTFCDSSNIAKSGNTIITVMVIDPTTVSIQELNKDLNLSLAPNPFSYSTSIQLSNPLQSATLSIYDILGKEVKHLQNLRGKEITIQRENMKAGMYFYSLTDKTGILGKGKLIVE